MIEFELFEYYIVTVFFSTIFQFFSVVPLIWTKNTIINVKIKVTPSILDNIRRNVKVEVGRIFFYLW